MILVTCMWSSKTNFDWCFSLQSLVEDEEWSLLFFLLHHLSFRFDAHPIEVSSVFTNAFGASRKKANIFFDLLWCNFLEWNAHILFPQCFCANLEREREQKRQFQFILRMNFRERAFAYTVYSQIDPCGGMCTHLYHLLLRIVFFSTVSCSLYLYNLYLYIS